MKVLSIDSSSSVATVSIVSETGVLGEYTLSNKKEHSVLLMDMIQGLLNDCSLDISDIDGFVVSKGPGSFTGLRIGMATVKGLSFGSKKPYISVSSLDALAYSLSHFNGIICPIMDALRDSVYTCLYKNIDGKVTPLIENTALDLNELVELIKEKDEPVIFTGDGVLKHKEYLLANLDNVYFAPNHIGMIRSSALGEVGLSLLQEGISDDDNSAPNYLKKPQAQRELEKRLGMNL